LASEAAQERIRELEEGIAQLESEAEATKASMRAIAVIVDRYRDDVGASGCCFLGDALRIASSPKDRADDKAAWSRGFLSIEAMEEPQVRGSSAYDR
jgi:hypothetical protein